MSMCGRSGRERERETIFRLLEEHGLIKRTRGSKPYAPKSDRRKRETKSNICEFDYLLYGATMRFDFRPQAVSGSIQDFTIAL